MEIIVAESAGFCFGVKLAVERVLKETEKNKIATLGPIAHNKFVIRELESRGVSVIDSLDGQIDPENIIVIRSHGVAPEIYQKLNEKGMKYYDCTCPCVAKIHKAVRSEYAKGSKVIILGDPSHPEIIGINGYVGYEAIILSSISDVGSFFENTEICENTRYYAVAQTTFNINLFEKISQMLKKRINNVDINNTICDATAKRQLEAEKISSQVDYMIVLGDRKSSNSIKLYDICKKNQKKTFFVESISEIVLNIFSVNDKIGITAGASTPPAIIKEALKVMSEQVEKLNENTQPDNEVKFNEETLDNYGSAKLHKGLIVKGTVINVVNGVVNVDLKYKSDGIIEKGEFSEDPTVDPADVVKPNDEIEVYIIHVNDKEGNVLLSRKKIETQKGVSDIEQAFESGEVLSGRIVEVVKGGVIAIIKGARAFVPSSQVSNRYVENLETLIGQEFNFNILQYDKSRRRIVAGRKELAAKELSEKKEKIFSSIEVGQKLEGKVSRIVDFGAFVDIGGVDGLIHISQLSWGRVKKVTSVLNEGDNVTVTVIDVDKEKEKISLTLKDINNDPWLSVEEKYPVGSIVKGKVVRMVPFGAFVELAAGLDGLIHISQISDKHVVKPEDELQIDQVIEVKVIDINVENKKISLSKKAADGVNIDENAEAVEAVENTETVETVEAAPEEASNGTEGSNKAENSNEPQTPNETAPE